MLLRILTLAAVLFAAHTVSADDTPAASGASIPQPAIEVPPPIPPHPVDKPAATVDRDSQSQASITRYAPSQDATRDQQRLLLQQKCAELDRLQQEIQQLRAAIGTAQQILVNVQMLEVSLTKLHKLGMDMPKSLATGPAATQDTKGILPFLAALKQNQLAKVLAEPTIVVVSGRPATFNVGGEIPVPSKHDSKAAVEFRNFGTELKLLANAIGDNRVRLEAKMRVSEIDAENSLAIDGALIPGFKVRECDTARELAFGQSAVLTGLVQQHTESVRDADGQIKEELAEFCLLVVITPELVDPPDPPAVTANRDDQPVPAGKPTPAARR